MGREKRRRIEVFGMWCYRKLLKISWVYKVTIEKVVNAVEELKCLYFNIKRRCNRLIGHILRHERLVGTVLEGTVERCKKIGRQRFEYVK